MKLLLHMCCGPCAAYPLQRLRQLGYTPTGYFFNPNIHPFKEFRHRLETAQEFAQKSQLEVIVDEQYALDDFLRRALAAMETSEGRCAMCYELRLTQAAHFAKDNGFDVFTTSLLVSPYQQHDRIAETGRRVAEACGIAFLYEDFRTGWGEGVQIAKELDLYRQPYCGCIFSERERYDKSLRRKKRA